MLIKLIAALRAFYRTKRLTRQLSTRADVVAWQGAQLARFLRRDIQRVAFYESRGVRDLSDLPMIDKAELMKNFDQFNRAKISATKIRTALDAGTEHVRGYVVGQSTGTSGNRGLFVISEAERFTWLGVILAKTLPDFPWVRHKVALILPGYGQIFKSAAQIGRLNVRFFDLRHGIDRWVDELINYDPDTIMAPPKVLRAVAERTKIKPHNVFSGAEVLDPIDRQMIEASFGTHVREIYMATEGLFGVACRLGVLHLAEEFVAFEFEPLPGSDLVTPLITDFTRTTQIMARYRMNDLLRLSPQPCRCGSPLQAVAEIVGRQDDVFRLGPNTILITPDILRNAILDADRRIDDFRLVQTGQSHITLHLAANLPAEAGRAACVNLAAVLGRAGVTGVEINMINRIEPPTAHKLRRVRCDWRCD
jgi:putative adenylate-forming enzyme